MPRDEGVGFPLGLAGTGGAVDCYLSLRKSCILMVSARAGEETSNNDWIFFFFCKETDGKHLNNS